MTFAAMSLGAWIAAAVATALAVVLIYLLRRRPRTQTVSNVEFWRRALARAKPTSLLATRIPWLVMLLSMAIAMLIVVELGDPRSGSGFSGTTVIVLDADRTMATRDEHGTRRLDRGLAIARQIVQADTVSGQVAIVRAGVHTDVLLPLTHRAPDADRALRRNDTDDGAADLATAVAVARGIVRTAHTLGRVVLVADRDVDVTPGVPVTFASVGAPGETLAITALDARRDPLALGEYAVRCEVRSYAAEIAHVHLVIRDRNVVLSDEAITLQPGEIVTRRTRGFSSAQAELSARLERIEIEGGHDALATDDAAFATVSPVVATHVLLVTPGNRYLQNALAADPSVDLETTDAAGLAARRGAIAGLARDQVIVLDRVTPNPPLDHPAQFIVGDPDPHQFHFGSDVVAPRITAFAADHRALAGLRFDQIRIASAHTLLPEGDDRVLVRSGQNALAIARDRAGARSIVLGFDTDHTDLVQRIAFPLFVHNALVWLDRREQDFRSWQPPGEPIPASGAPVVLGPSGEGHDARVALYDTAHAGIYHTATRAVAVSAADESGALATVPRGEVVRSAQHAKVPLGMLIAAAMLSLLALEWLLTQRGKLA